MQKNHQILDWIDTKQNEMVKLVEELAHINSYSYFEQGLNRTRNKLKKAFSALKGTTKQLSLTPYHLFDDQGNKKTIAMPPCLFIEKRPKAPTQILFVGHFDTVYSPENPFQKTTWIDNDTLQGPGVSDMKGGLVILLYALKAFEKCIDVINVGWKILLTPDEEIGSPCSKKYIKNLAKQCHIGLIFEPSFPNGQLASTRKGSINLLVIAQGKKAHSGREFEKGRNAITLLMEWISFVNKLNKPDKGITINFAKVSGGEAYNIVPDKAFLSVNIRVYQPKDLTLIKKKIVDITKKLSKDGKHVSIEIVSERPPKIFDKNTEKLFGNLKTCANQLGIPLSWKETGGVCDGNLLSSYGLANIDTMGAIGGNLHTENEYLLVKSLSERAKLTAHLLMQIAAGNILI